MRCNRVLVFTEIIMLNGSLEIRYGLIVSVVIMSLAASVFDRYA